MAVHHDRNQQTDAQRVPRTLHCLECDASSFGIARGWRALVSGGYEGDEVELGIYCPDCFAREFAEA